MKLTFKWDTEKAASNWRKHHVTFIEAVSVFGDPLSLTVEDPDHGKFGQRFITIGESKRGRILIVIHADMNDEIRIISGRTATKAEKHEYEG